MSCALNSISQINDVDKLQALLKDSASDQQEIVDKGLKFMFFTFYQFLYFINGRVVIYYIYIYIYFLPPHQKTTRKTSPVTERTKS